MKHRRLTTLAAGGLLGIAAALVGVAGVTTAHVKSVYLSCDNHLPVLHVYLTYYQPSSSDSNTVSVSIDGSSVLSTTDFQTTYNNTFSAGSKYVGHYADVHVYAWDDPSGSNGWTANLHVTSNACQSPTPSPSPSPTVKVTPSPSPSPSPTVKVTPTPTPTPTPSPTVKWTPSPSPSPSPSGTVKWTPSPSPTPTVTPEPTDTPFESFQGETATPEFTPPPTGTTGGSDNGQTPLFALLIAVLFGGLGLAAAQYQRRALPRGR